MALAFTAVQAEALTGTLKKIKDTDSITVGYRESSIPFSYLDGNGRPIGYAMELCGKVVDAVKADLKMPNLKVNYAPVTSSNRIPLLENGTIDLECGSTTNSVARQKQVAFGPTYFIINVSAAVKKDSGINDFAQLGGKTIVTTSGTTSVPLLKKYEKTKDLDFKEIYGKDHAESFLLMADGRAVAFVMDDILLAGQIANSKDPAAYKILPGSLRQEPYSMMLRKDDPQFKALVDRTIDGVMKSGEINKIYAKWFTSAIPPKGINLNFPETPAIKEAFAHPNDKGVE
nr:transporter substrate-binding domain-containing protein [Thiomonas sp. X19]